MAEYQTEITIDATPDEVFRYLTTADGIITWMGQHAELDPTPDGRFEVDINGVPVRGRFVEIHAPHRLVVTWGSPGNDEIPPGSSRVEFTLTGTNVGTHLRLVHSDLPESQAPQHGTGWTHFLSRLAVSATGRDPGPDPWLHAAEG